MAAVNTIVITGYGTNSHVETAHTARLAGSDRVDIVHFSDLVAGDVSLDDYRFLIFPGGFLDGDDLGAAQTAALRWRYLKTDGGTPLIEILGDFIAKGNLILGICNGFQLLVKLGVLPALDGLYFERQASLGHNDSARFEDRWVSLMPNPKSPCVFTQGLPKLAMPVRHGEGKLVPRNAECLRRMAEENLIALQYADPATGEATQDYPLNPNGSPLAIAGLTDPSGHVLGLMPHPEAFHHVTNHPAWTRGELDAPGTMLFVNAVKHLRTH
ncbi:MAG: phosphoribosylformylglycinamidine synthase subunit PurQ [Desulfovibrio sp.]|nr:phosphoribosylformylglycinamidine synthase subunit PurQ [Desulfovibrio sp.]